MTKTPYIFLTGASRGVGREIAQCLTAQNQPVKALVRSETAGSELEAMGIKVVMGLHHNSTRWLKIRTCNR